MVTIIFETHSTTFDNESKVASGWNDSRLSPLGIDQAKELGARYADQPLDAVFCSDLKRSYQTANIAFGFDPKLIFMDWRLRECNYGELTQASKEEVNTAKAKYVEIPFPSGESYTQCAERIASFLADLKTMWEGKRVIVIGHRATQYGLEHWVNNKPLDQCVSEAWKWQPGWEYQLK